MQEKKKFGGAQPGAGRPRKEINWEQFEQLCALQCTVSEMCSFLKLTDATIRDRAKEHYHDPEFPSIYKRFAEVGKCSLRRNQFVLSKKNATMAIFLGKQWLGQIDEAREIKDMVVHELREGIRRISEQSRSPFPEQPRMAS
jgi:predicted acetyltransferase